MFVTIVSCVNASEQHITEETTENKTLVIPFALTRVNEIVSVRVHQHQHIRHTGKKIHDNSS
jgi:hypothetical protein